jgi:hypothetical protein
MNPVHSPWVRLAPALLAVLTAMPASAHAAGPDVETILIVRHGEKPALGLGQLDCQGLNRALALPYVLEAKYGKPDVIFAPDPAVQTTDKGVRYDYVRPLATIEPTAIYFGMPVDASIGFSDQDALHAALLAPAYRNSRIVVAWEHRVGEALARRLVADFGGDPSSVPKWAGTDFDSIYVVRITRQAGRGSVAFSVDHEGLDQRPAACPHP